MPIATLILMIAIFVAIFGLYDYVVAHPFDKEAIKQRTSTKLSAWTLVFGIPAFALSVLVL